MEAFNIFILIVASFLLFSGVDCSSELRFTHYVILEIYKERMRLGKMKFGLYGEIVPKTVENFVKLCEGVEIDGKKYSYVRSPFHRIIPNFMIQGGDILHGDGTGSISIYGEHFDDENFVLTHEKHVIAMANRGPNTNGSQFYITTVVTHWLDGRHVVFGRLVKGDEIIQMVEATGSNNGEVNPHVYLKSCTVEKAEL